MLYDDTRKKTLTNVLGILVKMSKKKFLSYDYD